jgi:hypothetical protein
MKRKSEYYPPFRDEGEVMASWGEARLIEYLDGRSGLRGGSDQDRVKAREWISLFWHGAMVADTNISTRAQTFSCLKQLHSPGTSS